MDSQLISFAAGYMISGGTTIVLVTAYWDSIAKINNQVLLWSMIVAVILHAENSFLDGFLFLKLSRDFDFDAFYRIQCSVGCESRAAR
ncbi:hypothetical protein DFJ73DRAFT_866257 [Zopfochytrium polystomum]|nr:hypothetical protein DFJ73DRAFT_866257 [Zopfochytrium polystomum]